MATNTPAALGEAQRRPINLNALGTHGAVQRMLTVLDLDRAFLAQTVWALTDSCLDAPCAMPAGSMRADSGGRPYLSCAYREDL